MSDIKLFRIRGRSAGELKGTSVSLEREIQATIEQNLPALLGIRFVASEHSTGEKHRGRIDSLGLDENGSPVIIEYKRELNENVINQGLFYLDWLMDHRAEYEHLVRGKYGDSTAREIDWTSPRLVCIAGDFTRYDEHAVQQMGRNIELVRYRYFAGDLLLLELVNAVSAQDGRHDRGTRRKKAARQSGFSHLLKSSDGRVARLYTALRRFMEALGDDVQVNVKKHYVAFKRIKNFACVEAHPSKGSLAVFLKIDPKSIRLEPGFTRDVRRVGHLGTGDLQVTISTNADLEKAKALIRKSYEAS